MQRNPPQTSPFNICVANRQFWWSVANAKSHLPLKGGIATAMQIVHYYTIITKNFVEHCGTAIQLLLKTKN